MPLGVFRVEGCNMISQKSRFIFVHIPKTGGNSIQAALQGYADDRFVFRKSIGKIKHEDGSQGLDVFNERLGFDKPEHKHAGLQAYYDKLGGSVWDFLIFSAIRNPYDRVISHTAFLKGPLPSRILEIEELVLPKPQIEYLKVNDRISVSNFIRFEHLQADFNTLCEKLSLPRFLLPHKNASFRSSYSSYFSQESREMIYSKYKEEIELFGYEF